MSTEQPDNEATRPPEDGGEPAKPRRRRSPVAVASVAAAVLLVGGGGAYVAATASGGSDGGHSSTPGSDGTPPPLALDGYTGGGTGGTGGIAPGEPNPYGAIYHADGELPGGPDSAPVHMAKGEVTAAEVTRLAKALDIAGTAKLTGETWKVGQDKDGSGPSLQVNRQAPGTWTFNRYTPGTDNCKGAVCTSDPGSPSSHAVSEAAAKKAAAPVLKALGQDDAKLDAGPLMGAVRVVNADPKVGGLPTYGWSTDVQVGPDGQVVGGNGLVKTPVKGDTYPVIGARKTLDLLNRSASLAPPGGGRMGPGGCASAVPLKDRDEGPCGASAVPKRESVAVEKAVFGLASYFVSGHRTLVPSWLLEVRPSGADSAFTVARPAVDPRYLASPVPTPTATPSPRPTAAPSSHDVEVQGYTADGKDLTVSFTGGVCADYSVSASETKDTVTVKVTETPWQGKICILIAKVYEKTVRLDQPLGDRKVVGSDGRPIPEGKAVGASVKTPQTPQAR